LIFRLAAVQNILKKHEKNIEIGNQERYEERMSNFAFYRGKAHRVLMRETEMVYARAFTGGHRTEALKKLRVLPEDEKKVNLLLLDLVFVWD